MTVLQFFANAKIADDGFGDMKQGVFGYINHDGCCYLSDGNRKVVEVSHDLYREVDVAFGLAYDRELTTTEELAELLSEVGL